MSAVACCWSSLLLCDKEILTDRRRTETDTLPVSTEPSSRKMARKRFPTTVPHLSIIFPWEMVKMIPNICNEKKLNSRNACFFFMWPHVWEPTRMLADLSRTVEQAGRRSLRFWISELDRILKAQRQISSHKEPADKYRESRCKYVLCSQ